MKLYNAYVYIITNQNNTTLYIGVTSDILRRMYEHKHGLIDGFSKRYNLDKLVYLEYGYNIKAAIEWEKTLKKWNRAKKIKLIEESNPQWRDLSDGWWD